MTSAVILGMIVTMFPEPREQAKAIGVFAFVASAGRLGRPARGRRADAVDQLALDLLREPADRHRHGRSPRGGWSRTSRASACARARTFPVRGADHERADARRLHDRGPGRERRLGRERARCCSARARSRCWWRSSCARRAPQPADAAADLPLAARSRRRTRSRSCRSRGCSGCSSSARCTCGACSATTRLKIGLAFLPVTIAMGTLSIGYSEQASSWRSAPRRDAARGPDARSSPGLVVFAIAPVHANYVTAGGAVAAAARPRGGHRLPGADERRDDRRHPAGRGTGLGSREHHRSGRRGARAGHPRHALRRRTATASKRAGISTASALTSGYHLAFWVAAALVGCALVVVLTAIDGARAPAHAESGEAHAQTASTAHSSAEGAGA